jgi:Ni/Co efflux regulator RcnB
MRGPLVLLIGLLASGTAFAAKQAEVLGERQWTAVREYYNDQLRAGICPIGFAKKDDGCVPPRQARKWAVGKPLPSDAVRFDVPPALAAKLGKPPAGHRYVRVGADILLVSNRTKLVADGVLDLGRR